MPKLDDQGLRLLFTEARTHNGFVDKPLAAQPGERVRLFVLNVGPSNTSSFHVVGTIFDRVWMDGNPDNQMRGMQTVLLGSSSGAITEFVVALPADRTGVDLGLGIDTPASKLDERRGIRRHGDVRVVEVLNPGGPAVDGDVDLTGDRSGEIERDALPVRQADLLADDVADRVLHLGQCQLRRNAGVVGRPAERRCDVALVHPEVEDPNRQEPAVPAGADGRPGRAVEVLLRHGRQITTAEVVDPADLVEVGGAVGEELAGPLERRWRLVVVRPPTGHDGLDADDVVDDVADRPLRAERLRPPLVVAQVRAERFRRGVTVLQGAAEFIQAPGPWLAHDLSSGSPRIMSSVETAVAAPE